MKNSIILIGGFSEIIELCEENNVHVVGIVDRNRHDTIPLIGNDENADCWSSEFLMYELLITPDLPLIRQKLALYYGKFGFKFSSLISSHARISKSAAINIGTIVQAGVNVSAEVVIGKFVKLNTNANIMHNSTIGDFTTVAPNAVILGHVNIGKNCYIGANATILPNITICDNVVVGAGAVVTKNITNAETAYAGMPARPLIK